MWPILSYLDLENSWDPTIEDSYQKSLKVNNTIVQLDILDTAGQDGTLSNLIGEL